MADYILSKKTALAGLQCHKRLWWELHDAAAPELHDSPALRYRLREGTQVGALARSYVPGGRLIQRAGGSQLSDLVDETRRALADESVPAIYEGAFVAEGTLVFTDILERTASGWTLIEVKATTSVSEGEHVPDIAVQACVLRACGLPVTRYEIMHLDRACVHPDLSNLFARVDVTAKVLERMDDLDHQLAALRAVARADAAPHVDIGDHCAHPRDCPMASRCWPVLPKHHVSTLYRIGKKAASFTSMGYHTIDELPDDIKLGAIAARQRRAVRFGQIEVERDALSEALAVLDRPVAHLDFETVQPAIPRWPGCRPYDQVPVQLSCHVVGADGLVTHHEWLFDGDGDPRVQAAVAILRACAGARTVTAYFSSFEKECIRHVARACPEHAGALLPIADTIVDLLPIVREHVYHPEFVGSFSLKKVLPALAPELSYAGLAIAEGETAQLELSRMYFDPGVSADERHELRVALLAYCKRDTEAMVVLEERLRALAAG